MTQTLKKQILFCVFLLVFNQNSFAKSSKKSLEVQEVADSALRNYPKVLALYEEIEAAKGSVLASQGFFDVKLRQSYIDKSRGFYDGKYVDTELSKRNSFLGSEITVGYRKSFGTFENHETENLTNKDGEFRASAKFSLLQNSMIDESRLRLILSRLSVEESKFALENIKNEIRRDTKKAYYNWVIYGEIYNVYQELYDLALERNKQIEIRVKKGDLAKIILIENERNALNRKTAMIKAKQNFENSAIYLSLFYRDKSGDPIIAKEEMLPKYNFDNDLKIINNEKLEKDFILSTQKRADLNIIRVLRTKEKEKLSQAKNLYKPILDVEFRASNDISNENTARGQSKNEARVNFEIPLQRRFAKGEIAKVNADLNRINYEEKLLKESVKVNLSQIKNYINNIYEMHKNLKTEVDLSQKLEEAERTRFKKGGSDFFLINIREQDTASAKIANILVFGDYLKQNADYEAEAFLN